MTGGQIQLPLYHAKPACYQAVQHLLRSAAYDEGMLLAEIRNLLIYWYMNFSCSLNFAWIDFQENG